MGMALVDAESRGLRGSSRPGPPIQAPMQQCSDYRQVQQGRPRALPPGPRQNLEEDLAILSSKSRLASVLCLKLADLVVHLLTLALSTYILVIAVLVLFKVPDSAQFITSHNSSNNGLNNTNISWWDNELTVLGKSKWTMSFNHFILLFSIFHIVYGFIATICDLMFFHALIKRIVKVRYIPTVLPVHRLFFVVICWIDSVIFVTSTNITIMIDIWALLLIFFIGVIITVDTALILLSLKAVQGKSAPIFSTIWRNINMGVLLLMTALYTGVSQILGQFTWVAGPSLILTIASIILLMCSLYDTCRVIPEGESGLDRLVNFFLCVSGSNVLGLFSVSVVLHRLIFRTEFDSF